MEGMTEGRIVHVVVEKTTTSEKHRPAIVVNSFSGSDRVNLLVFLDGTNDGAVGVASRPLGPDCVRWATSVPFDDTTKELGTWHWIERA